MPKQRVRTLQKSILVLDEQMQSIIKANEEASVHAALSTIFDKTMFQKMLNLD